MRLLRLEVERFGALVDRCFDLDGRAFVLEGPNEAGKSSFHAALETVLYGFQPATREAHPYAAWGGDRAPLRLVALVELADGVRLQVERRLASQAGLRTAPEGVPLSGPFGRNAPLAELQAIPRPLFRAVYSLTANDMGEPDDREIQELVDGLLLGDRGLAGMRSIRTLRAEVAEERARLWRRDNRGEPRERQLLRELGEVRRAAREASDAERALALDEERLEATRRRQAILRAELARVERDCEDDEVLAELDRLERREAELARTDLGGFGTALEGDQGHQGHRGDRGAGGERGERADRAGASPPRVVVLEDPALVAEAVAAAVRARRGPRARRARERITLDERAARLVAHAATVERLDAEVAEEGADRREGERARREARAAFDRAHDLTSGHAPALAAALARHAAEWSAVDAGEAAGPTPGSDAGSALDPLASVPRDPLASVPVDALRGAVLAWRDVGEDERGGDGRRSGGAAAGLGVGVAALGLVAAGGALAGAWPREVGAAGLALALAGVVATGRGRGPHAAALTSTEAPPAVVAAAAALGLGAASLARPAATLDALAALDEAREAMRDWARARQRLAELAAASDRRRARWRSLGESLLPAGVARAAPTDALPRLLRDALVGARALAVAAERDRAERREARRALCEAQRRLDRERAREAALHEALRRALPEVADPRVAFGMLERQDRERSELVGERRALARHPRFADLERDPRRARSSTPTGGEGHDGGDDAAPPFWSPELRAARRERRTALRAELEATLEEAAQLGARLRAPRGTPAAELRARELELEDELRAARHRHDRLALLERALVAGERRFRAEHQPDVLRVASECLAHITGGRYDRIDYPDPEARRLMVRSRELDEYVPVGPPLSRGVREQVHLCLRLGTLEHLDRGREPLPLVLDEALVHWDPARRAALYPALRALTGRRQVILLTCQPEHAEESVQRLRARHVPLGSPGGRSAAPAPTPLDTAG